jgi:hypothetical protein
MTGTGEKLESTDQELRWFVEKHLELQEVDDHHISV